MPNISRMTPTTAVWSSRISLKRQGFSSTHCTKLSRTPTRMTITPAGADSHPDLSDVKGNPILSTAFCKASSDAYGRTPPWGHASAPATISSNATPQYGARVMSGPRQLQRRCRPRLTRPAASVAHPNFGGHDPIWPTVACYNCNGL